MTRAARIVFALLVLATLGAFVVTQKLKSGPPLVVRPHVDVVFSPKPDARVRKVPVEIVADDAQRSIAGDIRAPHVGVLRAANAKRRVRPARRGH